ncbi:MAG TPA: hypothetical protein VGJ12_14250 [Gemmatimonadaceae bacterium]
MNARIWLEHATIAIALAFALAAVLEWTRIPGALRSLLTILAGASIVGLIALVVNHVFFPFNIDLMESVVLQHARRAMHGKSIYPVPTPQFVPLAYNALLYIIAVPFLRIFGDTLTTLRMVSVIGLAGSAVAIFVLVRDASRSAWWGVVATGLFCAAYPVMDAYLDTAHSDAWLLCCALWGTYLAARGSRKARIAGILVLVAGFWFKQHGAVFTGVALLYLTWREGVRASLVYWLCAAVFGGALYILAPGTLLGPDFHYFTWQVPGGWSQLSGHTFYRVALYIAAYYPIIALAALAGAYRSLREKNVGLLDAQLGAAFVTAIMGSLDPGSSYNVLVPMGAFCIVRGTIELAVVSERVSPRFRLHPALVAALVAFATLIRDPRPYWLPIDAARTEYADLLATVRALPGTVYAPGIGQFVNGPTLYPAAHWVALEDIMRGPRRTAADSALARKMMEPARHPEGVAFMITNRPLESLSAPMNELAKSYALVQDFGNRFSALEPLPRPFDTGFPRYLYRSTSAGGQANGH